MTWLDRVYVAFDSLVDLYGERVNKIEVVRSTFAKLVLMSARKRHCFFLLTLLGC